MPMITPPPPLSQEEFDKRKKELEEAGKPITMENIDPDFAEWRNKQRSLTVSIAVSTIVGGVIMLTSIFLILLS